MIDLLLEEKRRCGDEVQRLREKMRQLSKTLVGRDPFTGVVTAESKMLARPIDALQQRITDAELQEKLLEVEIKAIESQLPDQLPVVHNSSITRMIEADEEVQSLKAQIASLRESLVPTELRAKGGKQHPLYVTKTQEIARLEKALAMHIEELRPKLLEKLKALGEQQKDDVMASLRSQLATSRIVRESLEERYKTELRNAEHSGDTSLDLEFTRAELAREEKVFEMIAGRVLALQTEMRAPGRVTLLHGAQVPTSPVESMPIKQMAMAAALSCCVVLGAAILREFLLRRITDSQQLERQFSVWLVAEVARLSSSRGNSNKALTLFEESVNCLRTRMSLATSPQRQVKVIAITSAVKGEGKTSLASQLAVSIVRSTSRPTLLIDGDMRSPFIHKIFEVPHAPGLADVLDGRIELSKTLVSGQFGYLDILRAGRLRQGPDELLGNERFEELMEQLAPRYDYIVIDTPPVLSASEALILCRHADATVLCTMQGRSRERQARMAYDRLRAAGAQTVALVLNGVPLRRYKSTYGSYRYHSEDDVHDCDDTLDGAEQGADIRS
jgi:capsular exopolysaccharide synthesis family protein